MCLDSWSLQGWHARPNHLQVARRTQEQDSGGEKVIADTIYADPTCSIRNPLDTPEVKLFKKRARARHENFNGRLKIFGVISGKFRHGHEKHKSVFEAVCVITQYQLENGHPLFDV